MQVTELLMELHHVNSPGENIVPCLDLWSTGQAGMAMKWYTSGILRKSLRLACCKGPSEPHAWLKMLVVYHRHCPERLNRLGKGSSELAGKKPHDSLVYIYIYLSTYI